jgi:tetratricopeptide (TPR) repeat protein
MSETYQVGKEVACRTCAAKLMTDPQQSISSDKVQPRTDPTICGDCRKDNGDGDLPTLDGRHLCQACRSYRSRIRFPLWARAASVVCILIGSWGFYRSIRTARGICAYRNGIRAFTQERYWEAAEHMNVAVAFMPQDEAFQDLHAFYQGHARLEEGKNQEAAQWFQKSLNLDPESRVTKRMVLIAKRRTAFDAGRYDVYFQTSESILELDGPTVDALLCMAPACACQFVATGKGEFRKQALAYLANAKNIGTTNQGDVIWIDSWVRHILDTHTIISLPDYWQAQGKNDGPNSEAG